MLKRINRVTRPISNWKYHAEAQITVGGWIGESIVETLGVMKIPRKKYTRRTKNRAPNTNIYRENKRAGK